jgi:hypothetical protein
MGGECLVCCAERSSFFYRGHGLIFRFLLLGFVTFFACPKKATKQRHKDKTQKNEKQNLKTMEDAYKKMTSHLAIQLTHQCI